MNLNVLRPTISFGRIYTVESSRRCVSGNDSHSFRSISPRHGGLTTGGDGCYQSLRHPKHSTCHTRSPSLMTVEELISFSHLKHVTAWASYCFRVERYNSVSDEIIPLDPETIRS